MKCSDSWVSGATDEFMIGAGVVGGPTPLAPGRGVGPEDRELKQTVSVGCFGDGKIISQN